MIVIKLGGSLISSAKGLVKEILDHSDKYGDKILIVPGGSVFADTVRKIDVSQEAAHWMAVLAMEQYAYYLADGTGAKLIDSLNVEGKGTYILLPYRLLKEKDELPHTWDVTSDTIAAWVAKQLDARFIKVTDVDGVYINGVLEKEIYAGELIGKETCVDRELPYFLIKNKMSCKVINGNCPGRVIKALEGEIIGTIVKG
ncbi:MAG: amino acid kinase [Candidatus Methanoperedens sp.]|nr:amino acid kinase [Candidatus Methanoperedens sp.]